MYFRTRSPFLRAQILDLFLSNLRLKATIFRLECQDVVLDLYLRILEFFVQLWVWVKAFFSHNDLGLPVSKLTVEQMWDIMAFYILKEGRPDIVQLLPAKYHHATVKEHLRVDGSVERVELVFAEHTDEEMAGNASAKPPVNLP